MKLRPVRTLPDRIGNRLAGLYVVRRGPKKLRKVVGTWWNTVSPPMPDELLPTPARYSEQGRQSSFFIDFLQRIESLQTRTTRKTRNFHLSYFPIAKNILWMSAAILDNERSGVKTVVGGGNPAEQEKLDRLGYGDWNPWLWSRIPRGQLHNLGKGVDDPERAWPVYFKDINTPSNPRESTPAGIETGGVGRKMQRILKMAACTKHVFRLNSHMQEIIEHHKRICRWPQGEKVLGMHVRRGDSATEDLSSTNRFSRMLEEYLLCADHFHRLYGISTIYLSTESEAEIRKAKSLRPDYRFLHQDYDRSFFPTPPPPVDIERVALNDPSIVEATITTALVDLYFLSVSSSFIGTFNSEFSTLAWLLCIADKGHLMPYVNLTPRTVLTADQGRLNGPRRAIQ